jgi:hypothetical protein
MLADFYQEHIEQLQLFSASALNHTQFVTEQQPITTDMQQSPQHLVQHKNHNTADEFAKADNNHALMAVIDHINKTGKTKVFFAAKGLEQHWAMKRQLLSPAYTTKWAEIPKVG